MKLSPSEKSEKCAMCANKRHCPEESQDMISAMGDVGIENTCLAFKETELLENPEA